VLYYAYTETEVLLLSIRPWDIRGNGQDYGAHAPDTSMG
jgi:hypothetical protein